MIKAVRAAIESLESRLLLSAVSLDSGTLLVSGDDGSANRITLSAKRGNLVVATGRQSQVFSLADVSSIQIVGGSKNDVIQVGAGISATTEIDGMGGDDHIVGSEQPGVIVTGLGKSVVNPGIGQNYVDVSLGRNVVNLPANVAKARRPEDTIVVNPTDVIHGRNPLTHIYPPSSAPGAPVMPWRLRRTPTLTGTASGTAGGVITLSLLSDSVVLAGGKNPTGTLTFILTAPDGSIADSETQNVSGDGVYATSNRIIASAAGAYAWHASYSGDGSNNPASDSGSGQTIAGVLALPQLAVSPTQSGDGGVVLANSVTISGGLHPTGTVTFTLKDPNGSVTDSETVGVADDGTYGTSNMVVAALSGAYTWQTSYSGDATNSAVTVGPPPVPVLPPPPSAIPPLLVPGAGFTGPIVVPGLIGTGFGAADPAIVRWDVVPYQAFSSTFNVGVVAFQVNGIARVVFSVNGGPWAVVSQMSLNPQTNVVEYWATLDATKFAADGPVEVRAIAIPNQGLPIVLGGAQFQNGVTGGDGKFSLLLYANAHNSLVQTVRYVSTTGSDSTGDGSASRPFASIYQAAMSLQQANPNHLADDGMIYLKAGDYSYAGAANRWPDPITQNAWLTISGAPGLSPDQVRIVSSTMQDSLATKLVHLRNLTVTTYLYSPNSPPDVLWLDGDVLTHYDRTSTGFFAGETVWTGGIYVTDTAVKDTGDWIWGMLLARNVSATDIGEHAFNAVGLLLNCTASQLSQVGTTFHGDVLYYGGNFDNVIIDGLTAINQITAQGLAIGEAGSTIKNFAVVNVTIDNTWQPTNYVNFHVLGAYDQLYILNSTFVGTAYWRTDAPFNFSATDVLLDDVLFPTMTLGRPTNLAGISALLGVTYVNTPS